MPACFNCCNKDDSDKSIMSSEVHLSQLIQFDEVYVHFRYSKMQQFKKM